MKTKNMTTLPIENSIARSPLRPGFFLIPLALALAWFAFSPMAQAADGDLGHGNTAEGTYALYNLTTGVNNTAIGFGAMNFNTTGENNTATGFEALNSNHATANTADGFEALYFNTDGTRNLANGYRALFHNTTGGSNTANGYDALYSNTTGGSNTANGAKALYNNNTGIGNTANGANALYYNTTGHPNTATGYNALFHNTTGDSNTANGAFALATNTTGGVNTANGAYALQYNTTGRHNTATGAYALFYNTTGSDNTANGTGALYFNTTGEDNTAIGDQALAQNTTGSHNIALGIFSGVSTTGDNNIDIGNYGVPGESNTIRIGGDTGLGSQTATFIAGVFGIGVDGIPVFVTSSGQLGVSSSSARFKQNIQAMGDASDALLALRPVTFRYKHEIDPDGIPQFGLVAEEVEKVNPDLVRRDAQGKVFTVRYEAVNAMLLNEFLKEHRKVEEQETSMTQLKATVAKQEAIIAKQQKGFEAKIAHQQTQIEALTAGLQKVSAQVEMSSPAPQMAGNNR
jgi:hypothetical protein